MFFSVYLIMFTLNQQISNIRNDLENLKINTTDFSGGIIEYTIYTILNLDDKVDTINTYITTLSCSMDTIISNAGVVIDDTSFARLDISNTFVSKQTFLDTINAESVVANKFFTDDNGQELVYGEYSNTYYVNDNENGTSGSINDTLALITSQDKIIRISAGSYSEDVLVSGKTLVGLSCPNVGGTIMTEIAGTRTFTIENSLRVRVSGLQINGMTTISGSQLRHRLEVCNFNGGLTITGGGATPLAEFMTIQDCEIAGSLTISAFTGIVYFYRVNFQNATFNISPAYSPQQVIMIDCAGIPDDVSLFAGNYYVVGGISYYKSGTLISGDFNSSFFVRNTTPSQDNELTSKLYVDTEVATNTSAIATNTSNIATNTSAISTNTTDIATNTTDIATNTSAIGTNTSNIATNTSAIATNTSAISDLSANKQDVLTAGDNITITGTTISSTGGGGSSAFVGFRAAGDGTFSQTVAFGQTISTKLDVYAEQANSTFDTESGYDNTLGIYTIPTGYTGWWEVSVKIYMLTYSEGGAQVGLRQNNTTIITTGDYQGERGDFTSYIYVTEGDEMYLRQDQNSGQYSFFASRSWWQMKFIGATLESVNGASSISASGSSGGTVGASWSRGGAINGVVVNNAYSTNVSIPFSVQQYPEVNCLYNAGDYIEIQISGKYLINYGLMSANNNTTVLSFLRINFGNNRRFNAYAGDSGFRQVHCSMILDLVAGDNIDVTLGTGTMIPSEEYRYFNGHLIN